MEDLKIRIETVIGFTPKKGVHNKALILAYEHVLRMINDKLKEESKSNEESK